MTTIASQITSLTIVYPIVYSEADQRIHQSSASLAFVWGIHRDRWIPRTKGQLRGKCFHLMTSSCEPNRTRTSRSRLQINDTLWSSFNFYFWLYKPATSAYAVGVHLFCSSWQQIRHIGDIFDCRRNTMYTEWNFRNSACDIFKYIFLKWNYYVLCHLVVCQTRQKSNSCDFILPDGDDTGSSLSMEITDGILYPTLTITLLCFHVLLFIHYSDATWASPCLWSPETQLYIQQNAHGKDQRTIKVQRYFSNPQFILKLS